MFKRLLDMVLGTVLAVLVTPIILVLAVVLAIQFRAWPFFTQDRVGLGGELFRMIKLRTMPPDFAAYADKYEAHKVALPVLARKLRSLHLDELPQLWLVPLGRMSLVGPRPEMAFLHEEMGTEVTRERLSVRPGCTGLWQVSVDSAGLIHENPQYDVLYARAVSLRLDTWILWHTARILLGGRPAVAFDSLPEWVSAEGYPALVPGEDASVA